MNINMFKLENIASKRQRAHYESQGASPVRAPFFDESKELSPTKYSSLIPMKGILNTKRLSPLRVYYKNMDVLKSQQQAKSAHKLSALPPIKYDPEARLMTEDNISHTPLSARLKTKTTDSTYRHGTINNTGKEFLENASIYDAPSWLKDSKKPMSMSMKKTGMSHIQNSVIEKPQYFDDSKQKREYENLHRRLKKGMELRMMNNNSIKSRDMLRYLSNGGKSNKAADVYSSCYPMFNSPRTEYPILG